MGRCPTIETARLLLRPFREDDVDAYAAVLQTRQVRASLHLPDDVGREQAWLGMAQQLGQWELRGTGQWALEEFWNFELPRDIVEERGYPQLTEQAKRKILGENLLRLHGMDRTRAGAQPATA